MVIKNLVLVTLLSAFLILYANLVWAENWALLVGINDYKYNSIGISDLKFCENDVDLFRETLIKYANFKEENIKILKSAEATKKNITNGFIDWLLVNAKAGDNVIFYFCGHVVQLKDYDGDEEDGLDECLAAHDSASLDIYFIRDDELGEWLSKINASDKTVILDCFHSDVYTTATSNSMLLKEFESDVGAKIYEFNHDHNLTADLIVKMDEFEPSFSQLLTEGLSEGLSEQKLKPIEDAHLQAQVMAKLLQKELVKQPNLKFVSGIEQADKLVRGKVEKTSASKYIISAHVVDYITGNFRYKHSIEYDTEEFTKASQKLALKIGNELRYDYVLKALVKPDLNADVDPLNPPSSFVGERWALLIGINKYDNHLISPSRYSVADATEFYNLLVDPIHGGFSKDKVVLLTDDTKEKPTDEVILRYLGWLSLHADVADTVFIYFSGHCYNDGEKSYLISQNAKIENFGGTTVPIERFNAAIKRLKAKTIIIIFDSEYPGEVSASGEETVIIYSACKPSEVSFESPNMRHGVFTYHLLEGLRGAADKDKDGNIMFSEVASYVEESVKEWAKQNGRSQTPYIINQRGSALIILSKNPNAR